MLDALFDDALLEKAKDECLAQLAFALKETDIYRVRAPAPARARKR